MSQELLATLISIGAAGVILPWVIWVTISIFNQRTDTAILKEILKRVVPEHE